VFIEWKRSAQWTIRYNEKQQHLVVSAGDDQQFAILEIDQRIGVVVGDAWNANDFSKLDVSPNESEALHEVIDQLALIGALLPTPGDGPLSKPKVGLIGLGFHAENVCASLAQKSLAQKSEVGPSDRFLFEWPMSECSTERAERTETERNETERADSAPPTGPIPGMPDFVVVVRSAGSFDVLLEATSKLSTPHLIIDATFHHTICVGPLVVPGTTACLNCLVTRLRGRWGEPEVALKPLAGAAETLVQGLVEQAVHDWFAGTSTLCTRSVRFDLLDWSTQSDVLVRTPNCLRCTARKQSLRKADSAV
jgi:bacteriocin biosynthesis cyclodehydratase domain-containing protein